MRGVLTSPLLKGSLFYLIFYTATAVYLPFLSVYFHGLGLNGWEIGLLSALFPAMAFLLAPPTTIFADRRRRRVPILGGCMIAASLVLVFVAVPNTFLTLLPAVALFTAFYSPLVPLADSTVVGMAKQHDLNYGSMRLWGSLGFAVAAAVCGVIWQRLGYRPMFAVAALLFFVNAFVALTMEERGAEERRAHGSWREIGRDRILVGVLITTFLTASAVGVEFTFAGVYLSSLGGSGTEVGLLYGLAALFELPGMRYSGSFVSRFGALGTLVLAYGLFAVTYAGYALAPTALVLLAFGVIRGLGYGLFYVGTVRLLNDRAPAQWAATVQGIMNATAYGLGQLIARPAGGFVYDAYGGRVLYTLCAGTVICATLIMIGMTRVRSLQPENLSLQDGMGPNSPMDIDRGA